MIQRKTVLLFVLVILLTKQTYQWPVDPEINCGTEGNLAFAAIATKKGNDYEYFCGGSLIHPSHIITTQSCAKKYPGTTLYASFENGAKTVKVKWVTVYNDSPDDRGISLLRLEEAIVVSAKIQPLCLPGIQKSGSSLMNKDDSDAGVWIATGNNIESVVVSNIPITSKEECAACFGDVHDLICAKKSDLPAHIGGNIINKMEESQNGTGFVLMGLFTALKPDCDSKEMVAIIDVSYYLDRFQINLNLALLRQKKSKSRRWLRN